MAPASVADGARALRRARAGADARPVPPRAQKRFLRTPAISLYTAVVGGLLGGACFMLVLWAPKLLGAGTAGCARARLPRLPTHAGQAGEARVLLSARRACAEARIAASRWPRCGARSRVFVERHRAAVEPARVGRPHRVRAG